MARVWIGTSGWTYSSWKGVFYPSDLPSRHYLEFYAREFPTTEVNYSFYHLPRPSTYEKWAAQAPDSFLFASKPVASSHTSNASSRSRRLGRHSSRTR